MPINNRLWLISDTHFGHDAIVRFCDRPRTHEVMMLSNWIKLVKENDSILHMGDVTIWKNKGKARQWLTVIGRMPGRKFLIKGNHDKSKNEEYETLAGFTVLDYIYKRGVYFTHIPIYSHLEDQFQFPWHTNIHGHIHNNDHRADDGSWIEGKKYINMSIEVRDYKPVQLGGILPMKWGESKFNSSFEVF